MRTFINVWTSLVMLVATIPGMAGNAAKSPEGIALWMEISGSIEDHEDFRNGSFFRLAILLMNDGNLAGAKEAAANIKDFRRGLAEAKIVLRAMAIGDLELAEKITGGFGSYTMTGNPEVLGLAEAHQKAVTALVRQGKVDPLWPPFENGALLARQATNAACGVFLAVQNRQDLEDFMAPPPMVGQKVPPGVVLPDARLARVAEEMMDSLQFLALARPQLAKERQPEIIRTIELARKLGATSKYINPKLDFQAAQTLHAIGAAGAVEFARQLLESRTSAFSDDSWQHVQVTTLTGMLPHDDAKLAEVDSWFTSLPPRLSTQFRPSAWAAHYQVTILLRKPRPELFEKALTEADNNPNLLNRKLSALDFLEIAWSCDSLGRAPGLLKQATELSGIRKAKIPIE